MSTAQRSERFPAEFFRREDEGDGRLFYESPRLVVHIDDHAISAIRKFFARVLPLDGVILDLMSSWRSHLPEEFKGRAVGLGLNAVEMAENPQLSDGVVHDLNADPRLPFEDESFDAVAVTVSIQYLTKPVAVFRDVNRVLKAGGAFHVIYSNRMFPTKAVAVWKALPDEQKAGTDHILLPRRGRLEHAPNHGRQPAVGTLLRPGVHRVGDEGVDEHELQQGGPLPGRGRRDRRRGLQAWHGAHAMAGGAHH